jgi:hypothetical protein
MDACAELSIRQALTSYNKPPKGNADIEGFLRS